MKQWKRLIYYLMINVLVSACTTLAVLYVWDRTHAPITGGTAPEVANVPGSAVPMISAANSGTITPPAPGGTPETPTETPVEPTPLQNVREYQVQPGDTLGLIAEKFNVSVDEIMKVNQLTNPDSLPVGLPLYIPLNPEDIPTPTVSPTATLIPQATSTLSGPVQAADVVISSVIGAGDLAAEHVFITRTGYGDLSLAGWQLKDENGHVFVFPQLELFQGGAVNVWTISGTDTVNELYWGLQEPAWRSGEKVTLLDDQGKVRATYTVP